MGAEEIFLAPDHVESSRGVSSVFSFPFSFFVSSHVRAEYFLSVFFVVENKTNEQPNTGRVVFIVVNAMKLGGLNMCDIVIGADVSAHVPKKKEHARRSWRARRVIFRARRSSIDAN